LLAPAAGAQDEEGVRQLALNASIERELAGGQAHLYRIALTAGQYLRVVTEQRGIDVVVTLFGPNGKQFVEVDSPNGTQGPEPVSAIIEVSGDYRLEVRSLEKGATAGRYEVRVEELRKATEQDSGRIAAERAYAQAETMRAERMAESLRSAIRKYEEAATLYRSAGARGAAAWALNNAGKAWNDLGDPLKARDYFQRALPEFQVAGDRRGEAVALNNIGRSYTDLGERGKSPEYYRRALLIFHEDKDANGEATLLINLGDVHSTLGEKQTALDYYSRALPLLRALQDHSREADVLNKIGLAYYWLGERQKALDTYEQALTLSRTFKDSYNEVVTLNNLGVVYDNFGDKQRALDYYKQVFELLRNLKGLDYEMAAALNNIGRTYSDLGERQKALDFYKQALSGFRAIKHQYGEGVTLTNIGEVYYYLGEKESALDYLKQALPIRRAATDRVGEATTLNDMGLVYESTGRRAEALSHFTQAGDIYRELKNQLGQAQVLNHLGLLHKHSGESRKALDSFLHALPLFRAIGSREGEATALSNIGGAYQDMGEAPMAVTYYAQALPLLRAAGLLSGEAATLSNLMIACRSLDRQRLAVFYGKQSIDAYQRLRSRIRGLDKEVQKTYLRSFEGTYRVLAELLIAQRRVAEAQQVLNAFKDQQYFDFEQAGAGQLPTLTRTPREGEYGPRYERAGVALGEVGGRIAELKRKLSNRQPAAQEAGQLRELEAQFATASAEFSGLLERAEADFSKPADEKDVAGEAPDAAQMQETLRRLKKETGQTAVAVYTLAGERQFHALVVTADDVISVSTAVGGKELNDKARELWGLLQSDAYNPEALSKELYNVVFKPVEAKLPADTRTILWSSDGNLRYVPMAALYDGRHYLVERYNHVYFTRADGERMTRAVTRGWTATGLGTSAAHTVKVRGDEIDFVDLPGVGEELRLLVRWKGNPRGIFAGETLQDAQFTRAAMLAALGRKRPVVHIASHFAFRPGDEERSFLLMGDGTVFTLAEMKQQGRMFDGVEMLTLSACNTAAQVAGADGREIDAFAELAQRLGANSVMATLWPVADSSTPWLMREFYRARLKQTLNKAEALRHAQLALLQGRAGAAPSPPPRRGGPRVVVLNGDVDRRLSDNTRADVVFVDAKNALPFKKAPGKPFSHPFYWSPFVLIGNWR
jgi:CHAT domain-containing protein/Tfp pilus assembly protein PilF